MKIVRSLPFLFGFVLVFCAACAGPAAGPTPAPAATTAAALSPAAPTQAPPATAVPLLTATATPIPSPTPLPVYSLGQLVQANELELAVVKVGAVNQQLWISLAAYNNGAAVQTVQKEQFHLTQAGKPALQSDCDTTPPSFHDVLQPGDILSGTICWKGTAANSQTRLEYQDQNNRVLATWDLSKPGEAAVPAEIATPNLKNPLHKPADAVLYKGLTVTWTLNKISSIGTDQAKVTYLKTFFTYENKGTSVVTLPKNLLSEIGVKTANGEMMWQAMVDRDCHVPYTEDVVVEPGKNLQVTVCFGTSGTSPQPGGRVILAYDLAAGQPDFINWSIK